jgi:hypothetical protein
MHMYLDAFLYVDLLILLSTYTLKKCIDTYVL